MTYGRLYSFLTLAFYSFAKPTDTKKTHDDETKSLTSMYRYLPCMCVDMTGSQLKIASTIDQFYDDGAPMGVYGVKYKEAVGKLEQQAQDELVRSKATYSVHNA